MIRFIRIVGLMLMGAGALLLAAWFIEPFRFVWPWIRQLPWPIQAGAAVAAIGLLLLAGSILWERLEDAEHDRSLLDDDY